MKKIFAILMSLILTLSVFASCDTTPATSSTPDTSSVEQTSSVEDTSSEETSSIEEVKDTEVEIKVPLLDKDLKTMKRVKILALGDSFTATSPMAYRYFLYEKLYQNGNFFEFVGTKKTPDTRLSPYYTRHQGTGGHTSKDGLEVFNSQIAGGKVNYDVVILFYGINDTHKFGSDMTQFKTYYTQLLEAIFTERPNAAVFAIGAPTMATADMTKEMVEEQKAKGRDITYINMYQRTDVTFDSDLDYIRQTVEKGHPNTSGYQKFADVVFNEIKDKITELNKLEDKNISLPQAVKEVTLDADSLTLDIGGEHEFIYKIEPETADTQSVLWHTSNESVCTISTYGTIKAVGTGKCKITAVSLDGKAFDTCEVTVTENKFDFPGDFKETVFKEQFVEATAWEEKAVDYILKPGTSNMSFGWDATQAISLSTLESYSVKKNFEMKFKATINANLGNKTDDRYVSMTFGDWKIAVGNCAAQVVLYYKGAELGRYVGFNHAYEFMEYSLIVNDGVAYVYRNQEFLFKANVAVAGENSGKVTIDYNCMTGVGIVDSILIKN